MKREVVCKTKSCAFSGEDDGCVLPPKKIKVTILAGRCKHYVLDDPKGEIAKMAFLTGDAGNDPSTVEEEDQ